MSDTATAALEAISAKRQAIADNEAQKRKLVREVEALELPLIQELYNMWDTPENRKAREFAAKIAPLLTDMRQGQAAQLANTNTGALDFYRSDMVRISAQIEEDKALQPEAAAKK